MAASMADDRARVIPLYLSWVGTLCGALLLLLADVLPVRLSFVRPDTLFVCLTEVEIAFVLFAWPVFVPRLGVGGARLLLEASVLLLAALPLTLIAANVSNVGAATFLRSQALVGALAALAGALPQLERTRGWRVGPWYVLGAFAASALLPFLWFAASMIGGADLAWIATLSPFWAAARADGAAAAVFGGLAATLFAAGRLGRKAGAS